ncbi:MAG: carboxypeptidase regulatory-like domain-containing protein [Bryobacteraceae bacterium]
MNRFVLALAFTAIVGVAGANRAAAQESRASLGGRVTDAQGAVMPNVDVVVTSDDTGVKQQTKTNDQGNWIVRFLIPGRYNFTVTAPGFQQSQQTGIVLQTADNKLVDVQLQLGATQQTISVTAEAMLVDTTSATSGTVITSEQITEMPSMSRVTTLLATLSPGVVAQDQNQNVAHLWSYNAASEFTANGGRNNIRSNSFELDGMPNVRDSGKVAFMPPPEAVAEFRVQMNAYDASIGRQAGATVQMTIKNGTSAYHGGLYEFNQNNFLNAKMFQTNLVGGSNPPVHFNEYGGTFGGPVWIPKLYDGRNRTFFFVSFDGTRNQDPRFSIRSVPTAEERQGDFSQSFTTQLVRGELVRYPIQVYDPASVDAKGFRQLFPGMRIPASRQSNIAQKILGYIPLPNKPSEPTSNATNNFVPDSTRQNKMAVLAIRLDQSWNNWHKSFASLRWYHEDELTNNYYNSPATGQYQSRIPMGLGLDHVWTVDAYKILNLRWNISRYVDDNRDNGAGFDPAKLGVPARLISQMEKPSFPRITGIFGDIGAGSAGNFTGTSYYTWSAAMTQVRGNMTMKYGGDFWVLQRAARNIGSQGTYDFGSNWTRQQTTVSGGVGNGSTMAAYLLGLPQGGSFPRNASSMYSQRFYAVYFQNDWRVTPKLTVNAGLRWDYERPAVERFNRMTSNYDPTALNPISDLAQAKYAAILAANAANPVVQVLARLVPAGSYKVYGAQLFAGVGGQSRQVYNGDFRQFQPRAGFAYRLFPRTVIRGGFGRFVQASWDNGGQNGFSRSTSFIHTRDNYTTPYDTLENPFRDGILEPTGSSLGPLTNLGQGVNWLNQNPQRPYSWEYSLHLQQEFRGWLFEVGYTHNKTSGIGWDMNQNLPDYEVWKQLRTPRFDANGRPFDKQLWDELIPNPFYQLPGVTGSIASNQNIAMSQFVRPIKILGDVNRGVNPWGKNQYDAMLVKVERRFRSGFSIINSFTWSKLFEDTSFWGPQVAGLVAEHKLGGEDRPFNLSIAPIWEFPIGRGKKVWGSMPRVADAVLGGWQLSGHYRIQSGTPTVFDTDSFFDGQNFALPRDQQSLDRWFDTTHFVRFPDKNTDVSAYPAWTGIQQMPGFNYKPAAGDTIKNGVYQDFATYIRRYPTRWAMVRNSRTNEMNMGVYKNFRIRERVKIQYRFETFNTLNHPRFSGPNTNPGSGSFGRVTPAQQNNPRMVQMALKINF